MDIRIIDIAKAAKFSPSTVSFVLNGRGDDIGISKKTQDHILKIARDFGYQPNIPAKKLRNSDKQKPLITIFFAVNNYVNRIPEMMIGLHKCISDKEIVADFIIKPYLDGNLSKELNSSHSNLFNGAVIAGALDSDIEAIEKMTILTPIILINRNSKKFNAVYCDNYKLGYSVADLFKKKGHKSVGLVGLETSFLTADQRKKGFLDGCKTNNLTISDSNIQYGPASFSGGKEATYRMIQSGQMPTAIFYLNNVMAVGSTSVFKQNGIRIPSDVEIITYGDNEYLEYTDPSISAIYAPIEEITSTAIELLLSILKNKMQQPVEKVIESNFTPRDSFIG